MKRAPKRPKRRRSAAGKSIPLEHVLGQAEGIKQDIAEAAGDLASVNDVLEQEVDDSRPAQAIEDAIVQNKEAETQVAKAAADLEQVNVKLAKEVTERKAIQVTLAGVRVRLAEVRADLSESRANEAEARQSGLQDALTGLPNRVLFEERLDHGIVQAKRHGWLVAVVFIDLDKFKAINDVHGHDLGDKALLTVADRLRAVVRGEDMVSRWGGDEFVCILLDVRQEADAVRVAEKMVERIAEAIDIGGTVLSMRASIGIAMFPGDGVTADVLFRNADQAMYRAKSSEERVVLYREIGA